MKKHAQRPSSRKFTGSAYANAGVDIDRKMEALRDIKKMIRGTAVKGVLSDIGLFGGLFASPGSDQVLVASTDGVGTKLKVAAMADCHTTIGQDLVNHCVNDILVQGARPLFFMDYVGTSRLKPHVFRDIVAGLCRACRENGCALLGGETAEMPGLYPADEYDLVGTIVGVVGKKDIVTGKDIRAGDVIVGLPTNGLQTNGFSLARKVIFEQAGLAIDSILPGARQTVADALLAVHPSFLKPVTQVMKRVRVLGMAHITGGGFPDNVPRILPKEAVAVIDRSAWTAPPVFQFIQTAGNVDRDEMYRVFNMGIGFVLVLRRADAARAMGILARSGCSARVIGWVEKGRRRTQLIN